MVDIKHFSNTASGNTFLYEEPNINAATINDNAREVMAAIKRQHERAEWIDVAHVPTFISSTSVTIPTDVTATYTVGRAVRLYGTGGMATSFGRVASSAFGGGVTTLTLSMYSGTIDSTVTEISYGIISPSTIKVVSSQIEDGAVTDTKVPAGLGFIPTGAVIPFAGTAAPANWLLCFGQAVSRASFSNLFAAIGTTYGAGDGSTTFNLPDMRGRTPFGKDDMGGAAVNRITNAVAGITATTLGATGGNQNPQNHTHVVNIIDPGHAHANQTYPSAGGNLSYSGGSGSGAPMADRLGTASSTTGITATTNPSGSGGSGNVPPAIILNYIIRT